MKYLHDSKLTTFGVVFLFLTLFSSASFADFDGRTGRTLKSGTNGCSGCHGSLAAGVTVNIAGPDTVVINAQVTYTVTISGGPLTAGGIDIAASTGTLANISTDLKVVSGELTHTSPKLASSGAVTFQFRYTAPATPGTQILYSTGLSSNNDGGSGGDQWNFSANKSVTVVIAVPVELTSFTAVTENKVIKLMWSTATELNNYGFQIERKDNNLDWKNIGFVKGAGNSISMIEYSFIDLNITRKNKYTYRLNQIDNDGTNSYSDEVEINVNLTPVNFSVDQNYPNPFNPSTTIRYIIPVRSYVSIKVYNTLGKEVANLVNWIQEAAEHTISFDASKVSSGIYYYTIKAGSFIQTRKMIVLK